MKIRGDFWLSRAAGGLTPLFIGNSLWSDYQGLIRLLRADDAESVINFLKELQDTKKLSQSQKAYFESPNQSFPQQIYYPKILQMLALKKNPYLREPYAKIASLYPCLTNDPYLKALGF